MIRLQDIADMTGVSRTTVSNVLHGKTKKVSKETMARIRKALEETSYEPNMASVALSGKGSKILGFVLGYEFVHGYPATMDPFISELLATVQQESQRLGYYVMIIGGSEEKRVLEIASRWNIDGLIFIGYPEDRYRQLRRKLNKNAVLIDTYTRQKEYDYLNIGIDDYDGGYQVGKYLLECGYPKALFIAEETKVALSPDSEEGRLVNAGLCNNERWRGFRKAMEKHGYCSRRRFIVADQDYSVRMMQYEKLIPDMLEVGAVFMASDYNAIEMINFLHDHGISVPDQVSVVGFDDCMYAEYVRPCLTTVHQNVPEKGKIAVRRLIRMLNGEMPEEMYVVNPVKLVIRDSVCRRKQ